MQPSSVTTQDLLNHRNSFAIPPFQRRYCWTTDDQIQRLWEDIVALSQRRAADKDTNGCTKIHHWLGPMVTKDITLNGKSYTAIVDGQQRVTTVCLMAHAINTANHTNQNGNNLVKIDFADSWDRDAFEDIIRNPHTNKQTIMHAGYRWMCDQASTLLRDDEDAFLELQESVLEGLTFAYLELDTDDDESIIYETLNSLGQPLSQMDLVKNQLLYGADATLDQRLANSVWPSELKDGREPYWTAAVRGEIRGETMMSAWLTAKGRNPRSRDRISATLREYSKGMNAQEFKDLAADLVLAAETYRAIVADDITDIQPQARMIRQNEQIGNMAILLYLLNESEGGWNSDKAETLALWETYIARRLLQGNYAMWISTPSNAILALRERGQNTPMANAMTDYLASLKGTPEYPTDRQINNAQGSEEIRISDANKLLLLQRIEDQMREENGDYPLNHDDPLRLTQLIPSGKGSTGYPVDRAGNRQATEEKRKASIGMLGNYTLTTDRGLSGKQKELPWPDKVNVLRDHSGLAITNDLLLQYGTDRFADNAVRERNRQLVETAQKLWPELQ